MIIRKAEINELDFIMQVIKDTVRDMQSKGIYQWDEFYPDTKTISEDISEGNLYVYFEENIKGIIVLNENQDEEYKDLVWKYNSGKQLVIHRLCVHLLYQGKGIAKSLIDFAEKAAKENKYEAIRLDTFTENKKACGMYEKAGYEKVGSVFFRKGEFYCFEKNIGDGSLFFIQYSIIKLMKNNEPSPKEKEK